MKFFGLLSLLLAVSAIPGDSDPKPDPPKVPELKAGVYLITTGDGYQGCAQFTRKGDAWEYSAAGGITGIGVIKDGLLALSWHNKSGGFSVSAYRLLAGNVLEGEWVDGDGLLHAERLELLKAFK